MRILGHLICCLLIVTAAGIGPARAEPFKLKSGKVLDILSIKAENTAKGPALVLSYGTRTPIHNTTGLREEADELWEFFLVNVEKVRYRRAVIRAAAKAKGGKTVDFVYLKRGGEWRTLAKGMAPGGKLTEAFLRSRLDRYRKINAPEGRNVTKLYTARNWTITYAYPPELGIGSLEFDRDTFLRLADRMRDRDTVSERNYGIEIGRIRVAADGRSATVEGRIKGEVMVRGRMVAMRGRIIDVLATEAGAVFSTRMAIIFEEITEAMAH